MTILIDGYNLLHASGILGRGQGKGGLERSRLALLNFLVESLPANELAKTTVVFDAHEAPFGLSRKTVHRGLNVYFASKYDDADSMIEELIRADSAPRKLTVVSSDHRLHRAAKKRKATPVDSDRWFHEVIRNRAERGQQAEAADIVKPEGPFSDAEIARWMREFGEE